MLPHQRRYGTHFIRKAFLISDAEALALTPSKSLERNAHQYRAGEDETPGLTRIHCSLITAIETISRSACVSRTIHPTYVSLAIFAVFYLLRSTRMPVVFKRQTRRINDDTNPISLIMTDFPLFPFFPSKISEAKTR